MGALGSGLGGKHVLVTGGAGFIGSHLCDRLLELNCHVRCLDNFSTGTKENLRDALKHPHFELIEGDITDFGTCSDAVSGCEVVFHQAALGSVPRSVEAPLPTHHNNVTGTLNVFEACRQKTVKRVVYAASSSTYGDSPTLPKREEVIGQPLSPYGVTKLVNEIYAGVYHRLYGLEVVGLRYFNVFGSRQDPNGAYAAAIPRFIQALLRGQSPVIFGTGEQTRDFTYIENVVDANLLSALAPAAQVAGEVFNIACGEQTTVNQLVETLRNQLAQLRPEVAAIEPSYKPARTGDILHSKASIDKATRLLGYNPSVLFAEGIARASLWYLTKLGNLQQGV